MRATHSNAPTGGRDSEAFLPWLASTLHIKDIDKSDRAKLMRAWRTSARSPNGAKACRAPSG
jgi:hypothetical protein